jgi:hypothetical protein
MGNCATCCGKADANEVQTERNTKGRGKNTDADKLLDEIQRNG